jgi:hypothetical protein
MVFVPIKDDPQGGGMLIGASQGTPYCAECADLLDAKAIARAIPPLPSAVLDAERAEKAAHEASWYEPGGKFFATSPKEGSNVD